MNDQQIDPDLQISMSTVAELLDRAFPGYGFALLVFPLNSNDTRISYISNADRADMIASMKAFVAGSEHRTHAAPETRQ
ncbi:hypothetical protein [Paraburkholderia caribensis]|uniref:hypothetical protein n=1 Tax=Paraburkholderia caribensis TaxID=75105 RepID=UPI001CB47F79|nr:hypothetical protein [Paraburkholderia caribensis]CAG9256095.1 conserved hypothetical protein [Paraburkholderia caribensis]